MFNSLHHFSLVGPALAVDVYRSRVRRPAFSFTGAELVSGFGNRGIAVAFAAASALLGVRGEGFASASGHVCAFSPAHVGTNTSAMEVWVPQPCLVDDRGSVRSSPSPLALGMQFNRLERLS